MLFRSVTLSALCISAYAHEAIVKEIEPGKLRFFFDDDSPMSEAFITVYTKDGTEIATARADADGIFVYTDYEGAGKISGADASGHLVFFNIKTPAAQPAQTPATSQNDAPAADEDAAVPEATETAGESPAVSRQVIIVAVLTSLCVIAYVSYANNKKKAKMRKEAA